MSTVRNAITQRVATLAASLGVTVAYENVGFQKPVNNAVFLELIIQPSATIDFTVDGKRQSEVGLVQINCWCPVNKGTKQTDDLVSSIQGAFKTIPQVVGGVNVMSTPSARPSIVDPTGYRITPVVFSYRHETSSF